MYRLLLLLMIIALSGCDLLAPGPEDYNLEPPALDSPPAQAQLDGLSERIDRVLQEQLTGRRLSSVDNAAWQIMHGVICYGHDLPLDTPDRGTLPALDYLFNEGIVRGWQIMPGQTLENGRRGVKAYLEPGSYIGQGHVDQWIAICAMADLPPTDSLTMDGQTFTLLDWATQARLDVATNPLNEFSWTLIALTHYFPDDPHWIAGDGSHWSWERMVEQEVRYDINSSPCGGAHRLVGLARALQAKRRLKLADSPAWSEARGIVDNAIEAIEQMRCADGSLSSHYLERPGTSRDLGATLASTGHLLEFMAVAAEWDKLQEPWLQAAAVRLCEIFEATRTADLDCGACYHALNGLKVYRQRLKTDALP